MPLVSILGGGESGVGAAILAQQENWDVWLSDFGEISDKYKTEINNYNIPFEEGGHDVDKVLTSDLIIKSPGIPEKASIIKAIRANGIPIISEIEFGARYTNATIIGITGSNGKTTTTLLTYHLLRTAGFNVGLAGNIGDSFARSVALKEFDHYVLEISSFQLDDIEQFRCDVAMLLNITADHLDRYENDINNYAAAKMKISNHQGEDDIFIFNGEDPITNDLISKSNFDQRVLPILSPIMHGDDLWLGGDAHFNLSEFSLKGAHNLKNLSFALMTALDLKADGQLLQKAINTFEGAPHRLEFVGRVGGIEYINDSKATNVDAVFYALNAMDKKVVWIAGGVDKGNDYTELKEEVEKKVKAIVCIGIDNEKLHNSFNYLDIPIVDVQSAKDAVVYATQLAQQGDVVLLSPACASFDLFDNYEHRGNLFKQAVLELH